MRKHVMGQVVRQTQAKPQAYWETIRDRIDAAKAVDVINKVLNGGAVSPQRAAMAWQVANKMLPSLAAVSVQVEHKVSANWQDIMSKALESGIDPNSLIPQEKPVVLEHDSDTPLPPDIHE